MKIYAISDVLDQVLQIQLRQLPRCTHILFPDWMMTLTLPFLLVQEPAYRSPPAGPLPQVIEMHLRC